MRRRHETTVVEVQRDFHLSIWGMYGGMYVQEYVRLRRKRHRLKVIPNSRLQIKNQVGIIFCRLAGIGKTQQIFE